jgi:regulator of protease activity HflC (stomatin/prohibitin superfamily)
MSASKDNEPVASHKARLSLLGRLGLTWVGGREVAVVLKGEKFHRLQGGPGYFYLVPGMQRIAQRIAIGPDYVNLEMRELNTTDGLQVGIDMLTEYHFDPRNAPAGSDGERAKLCKRVPLQTDRRALLMMLAQRAMQSVTSKFRAEQICRGQVWDDIEETFFDALDRRMLAFGMKLERLGCAIQRAIPPDMLRWRFEMAAQRAINIQNLGDYAPYQISQALRSEAIEALKGMQGSSPYLNLHDLTTTEQPTESPKQIVEGTARPVDNGGAGASAAQKPKRGRSRLDPE